MSEYVILVWQHSDGRKLPFNHPDARAERLEAVRKNFKHSPGFWERMEEEYRKQWPKPSD